MNNEFTKLEQVIIKLLMSKLDFSTKMGVAKACRYLLDKKVCTSEASKDYLRALLVFIKTGDSKKKDQIEETFFKKSEKVVPATEKATAQTGVVFVEEASEEIEETEEEQAYEEEVVEEAAEEIEEEQAYEEEVVEEAAEEIEEEQVYEEEVVEEEAAEETEEEQAEEVEAVVEEAAEEIEEEQVYEEEIVEEAAEEVEEEQAYEEEVEEEVAEEIEETEEEQAEEVEAVVEEAAEETEETEEEQAYEEKAVEEAVEEVEEEQVYEEKAVEEAVEEVEEEQAYEEEVVEAAAEEIEEEQTYEEKVEEAAEEIEEEQVYEEEVEEAAEKVEEEQTYEEKVEEAAEETEEEQAAVEEDWFNIAEIIDEAAEDFKDDFIDETNNNEIVKRWEKKRRQHRVIAISVSIALCLIILIAVILFIFIINKKVATPDKMMDAFNSYISESKMSIMDNDYNSDISQIYSVKPTGEHLFIINDASDGWIGCALSMNYKDGKINTNDMFLMDCLNESIFINVNSEKAHDLTNDVIINKYYEYKGSQCFLIQNNDVLIYYILDLDEDFDRILNASNNGEFIVFDGQLLLGNSKNAADALFGAPEKRDTMSYYYPSAGITVMIDPVTYLIKAVERENTGFLGDITIAGVKADGNIEEVKLMYDDKGIQVAKVAQNKYRFFDEYDGKRVEINILVENNKILSVSSSLITIN